MTHHINHKSAVIAAMLAAATVLGWTWTARQGGSQAVPCPSLDLHYGYGTEPSPAHWQEPNDLTALMTYDTSGREIEIYWRHADGTSTTFIIALTYYPTAAECFDAGTCFIAGRDTRGRTVLERMAIQPPHGVIDLQGNKSLVGAAVLAVDRIYDEATIGRDCIRAILPRLDDQSHLMLSFWDSGDLYDFDTSTEAYQLIASADQQPNVLHVPELANRHYDWGAARHVDHGYIYWCGALLAGVSPVVMRDENLDGSLDSYVATTPSTWVSLGFGDPNKYVD